MIFDSIQQKLIQVYFKGKFFIFSHKKVVIAGALLFALVFVLLPHFSQAAEAPSSVPIPGGMFLAWILYLAKMLIYWLTLFAARILAWMLRGTQGFLDSELVTVGWSVVRDTANMFFILILLVIAFGTILRLEALGLTYKRLLTPMIVAILLVNFSRTICNTIVNFCDTLMEGFIGGISGGKIGTLPDALVHGMQLDKMWETAPLKTSLWKILTGFQTSDVVLTQAFDSAYASVALIAMLAVCIFLMIRVLALSLLTIAAPLVFVMQIIPATKTYVAKWWPTFIKYALYGPIAAFCVALAGKMSELIRKGEIGILGINEMTSEEVKNLEGSAFASAISTPRAIVEGLFVCGILFASVLAAQQLGLHGAGAIIKLAQRGMTALPVTGLKAFGRGVDTGLMGAPGKRGMFRFLPKGVRRALPYLSPTQWKESRKRRFERLRGEAIGIGVGRVRQFTANKLRKIPGFSGEEADYARISQRANVGQRAKELEEAGKGSHEFYSAQLWKALDAGDLDTAEAALYLTHQNLDLNEPFRDLAKMIKKQPEKLGQYLGKDLADKVIKEGKLDYKFENMRDFLGHTFGEDRAKLVGLELGQIGKSTGDYVISEAEYYDTKTKKWEWRSTEEQQEGAAFHNAKLGARKASDLTRYDVGHAYDADGNEIFDAETAKFGYIGAILKQGIESGKLREAARFMPRVTQELIAKPEVVGYLREVTDGLPMEKKVMGHRWLNSLVESVGMEIEKEYKVYGSGEPRTGDIEKTRKDLEKRKKRKRRGGLL